MNLLRKETMSVPCIQCSRYKHTQTLLQFFNYHCYCLPRERRRKKKKKILNGRSKEIEDLAMAAIIGSGGSGSSSSTILITLLIVSLGSHAFSQAEPPLMSSSSPTQEPVAPPMESGGTMAPGPAEDPCLMALFNMSDCLTYVEQGSQLKTPDSKCCPELAGLVDSQPICLCKMLGNTYSGFGIQIDNQKALNLPTVCGLQAPPASDCALLGYPVNLPLAPNGAPVPSQVPPPVGAGEPMESPMFGNGGEKKIISTNFIGISLLISLIFSSFLHI